MNTTELIKHWTMQGATPDVDGLFWSTADVFAAAGADGGHAEGKPAALRMRGSDEEDWRPLLLGAGSK